MKKNNKSLIDLWETNKKKVESFEFQKDKRGKKGHKSYLNNG